MLFLFRYIFCHTIEETRRCKSSYKFKIILEYKYIFQFLILSHACVYEEFAKESLSKIILLNKNTALNIASSYHAQIRNRIPSFKREYRHTFQFLVAHVWGIGREKSLSKITFQWNRNAAKYPCRFLIMHRGRVPPTNRPAEITPRLSRIREYRQSAVRIRGFIVVLKIHWRDAPQRMRIQNNTVNDPSALRSSVSAASIYFRRCSPCRRTRSDAPFINNSNYSRDWIFNVHTCTHARTHPGTERKREESCFD